MQIVFNELSFPRVNTQEQAKKSFDLFLNLCIALHKLSLDNTTNILRIGFHDFMTKEVFIGYNFHKWLKSLPPRKQVEKSLIIKMLAENKNVDHYSEEITYEEKKCFGLGYASENDLISISFSSLEWDFASITLNKLEYLEEEANLREKNSEVKVKHSSKKEHIITHQIWLKREPNYINSKPSIFLNEEGKMCKDTFQKYIFPNILVSKELFEDIGLIDKYYLTNCQSFYKILADIPINEKIPIFQLMAQNVANINGWFYDERLTKKNNRKVYFAGEKRKKMYLSVDTQHCTFELYDSQGYHQGEFYLNGIFKKYSKHKLNI